MSQVAHQAGAYPGFRSMKLVHRRVNPSIKFAGTHLYTWVERGTVRVKCLAHEHNAMSPARSRTRTARSGVECTNHEATDLLTCQTEFACLTTALHYKLFQYVPSKRRGLLFFLSFHLFDFLRILGLTLISRNVFFLGTSSCSHQVVFERRTCKVEFTK